MKPLKSATEESLQSYKANEFMQIMFDRNVPSFEERLTAVYLRALQPDCFGQYRPRSLPLEPREWRDALEDYTMLSDANKPKAWQAIQTKFVGYLKARTQAESENDSDVYFLKQMLKHFEDLNLPKQAEIVKQRLWEFQE